jgi:hypothetical protein
MLPTSVGQTDGRVLRFIASRVLVTDEDITIGGSLEER